MIKIVSLLVFLLFSLSGKSAELVVVADEWPPFSGSKLVNNGLSLDVINQVLSRAGHQSDINVYPWARIMDGAMNGKFDVVGSLFYSRELEQHMIYSDPYYQTPIKFVSPVAKPFSYFSLKALEQYSIAVGDGFLYSEEFDNAKGLNKVVVLSTTQCLQMVASGRTDLTLDSEDVLRYTLKNEVPNIKEKLLINDSVLTTRGIHMAVSRSTPNAKKIIAEFNRVLKEMKTTGELQKIIEVHSAK